MGGPCRRPRVYKGLNSAHGRLTDLFTTAGLAELWAMGYAPVDIITVIFRVVKNYEMPEYIKLEFIKVRCSIAA